MQSPEKSAVLVTDRARSGTTPFVKKIIRTALKELGLVAVEVSVLLADDSEIRELNRRYRNINRATDVLSFPMEEEGLLGDIVVSMETARREAASTGFTLEQTLASLIIHGLLHLIGYDHVKGGRQAAAMKKKEREILAALLEKGLLA